MVCFFSILVILKLKIEELTLRSWLNTQENRRKTIQKADVAAGAEKSEMFDFLIDILPRDDMQKVCFLNVF